MGRLHKVCPLSRLKSRDDGEHFKGLDSSAHYMQERYEYVLKLGFVLCSDRGKSMGRKSSTGKRQEMWCFREMLDFLSRFLVVLSGR